MLKVNNITLLIFIVMLGLWIIPGPWTSRFMTWYMLSLVSFGLLAMFHEFGVFYKTGKWHTGTLMFSSALLSWGIAEIIWNILTKNPDMEIPYPSLADIPFTAFYPLITGGLFIISAKVRGSYQGIINWIVLAGTGVISAVYAMIIFKGGAFFPDQPELLKSFFDLSYLVWDATLLVFLLYLAGNIIGYSKSKFYSLRTTAIIGVGVTLLLVADILFAYATDLGIFQGGGIIDVVYLTSAFLIAYGTIGFHQVKNKDMTTEEKVVGI
jgi:hypothetical protein